MLYKGIIDSAIKDVDAKQGIVTGYFASFDTLDDGGDIIERGAFKKSVKERGPDSDKPRIKHLYMHDPWQILGAPQVLKEDKSGLYFETKIVQTTLGADVLKLYEEGVITEHSIGYDVISAKYDDTVKTPYGPARRLKELRLWEGSSVTWGMNSNTPTTGVKSLQTPEHKLKQIDAIEKLLRNGSLETEELFYCLDLWVKQLRDELEALDTEEPDETTPQVDEPLVKGLDTLCNSLKALTQTYGG
jgi:HK97 family phage prohead protease